MDHNHKYFLWQLLIGQWWKIVVAHEHFKINLFPKDSLLDIDIELALWKLQIISVPLNDPLPILKPGQARCSWFEPSLLSRLRPRLENRNWLSPARASLLDIRSVREISARNSTQSETRRWGLIMQWRLSKGIFYPMFVPLFCTPFLYPMFVPQGIQASTQGRDVIPFYIFKKNSVLFPIAERLLYHGPTWLYHQSFFLNWH